MHAAAMNPQEIIRIFRKERVVIDAKAPNGVLDGGLGGFTVVKELQKILPEEDIIYLGDGKNNPYGNRSGEDIVHLTKQCLNFLKEKRVKAVAVACNTISTMIDHYQPDYDFKIFSIVQAGSDDAVRMDLQQIGVLSTVFTAKTECYAHLIHQRKPQMNVYAQGCPMLARLIEDGDFDRSRIDAELRKTLGGLMERYPTLDSLVFGCTHFPLVQENIERLYPQLIHLINPAETQARQVKEYLEREHALNVGGAGTFRIYTTGSCESYRSVAERVGLKTPLSIELVPAPQPLNS